MKESALVSKRKRQKNGICTYCGKHGPTQSDHVVPRCIFGDKVQGNVNLVTVPSCPSCNGRYSKLEEKFKIEVSMQPDPARNAVVRELWDGSISRSMQRPRSRGVWQRIGQRAVRAWYRMPSGLFVPTVGIRLGDSVVPEMVDKIVKGLSFRENRRRLPDDYCVGFLGRLGDFVKQQTTEERRFLKVAISDSLRCVHPDVFAYGFVPHDGDTGIWFLFFYKYISFAAVAGPEALFSSS